jgi:hypothetical protein
MEDGRSPFGGDTTGLGRGVAFAVLTVIDGNMTMVYEK